MLKLPKGKKNQKIHWHCLEFIETKQNIYDYCKDTIRNEP